jgi:hypothetical protein
MPTGRKHANLLLDGKNIVVDSGSVTILSGGLLSAVDTGSISLQGTPLNNQMFPYRISKTISAGMFAASAIDSSLVSFDDNIPAHAEVRGAYIYIHSAMVDSLLSGAWISVGDGIASQGYMLSATAYGAVSATYHTADTMGALLSAGMIDISSSARTPNVKIVVSDCNLSQLSTGKITAYLSLCVPTSQV